jgi:hypothetical protein
MDNQLYENGHNKHPEIFSKYGKQSDMSHIWLLILPRSTLFSKQDFRDAVDKCGRIHLFTAWGSVRSALSSARIQCHVWNGTTGQRKF